MGGEGPRYIVVNVLVLICTRTVTIRGGIQTSHTGRSSSRWPPHSCSTQSQTIPFYCIDANGARTCTNAVVIDN